MGSLTEICRTHIGTPGGHALYINMSPHVHVLPAWNSRSPPLIPRFGRRGGDANAREKDNDNNSLPPNPDLQSALQTISKKFRGRFNSWNFAKIGIFKIVGNAWRIELNDFCRICSYFKWCQLIRNFRQVSLTLFLQLFRLG